MAVESVYSTKDSNRNRKIEQAKTLLFKTIAVLVVISASIGGCYYYYNFTDRPALGRTAPVEVEPGRKVASSNDAHVYQPELAPFEQ